MGGRVGGRLDSAETSEILSLSESVVSNRLQCSDTTDRLFHKECLLYCHMSTSCCSSPPIPSPQVVKRPR